MENAPQNYLSRDADGFMDKITDLMFEEEDAVIGPPGSSQKVLVPIKHVGIRPTRTDNVAGTGLTWTGNETKLVADAAAVKLIQHPDVWEFDAQFLADNSGVTADGLFPIVVHVSQADFEALNAGEAEVMVVHHNEIAPADAVPVSLTPDDASPTPVSLSETLAAMDKDQLLAYAETVEVKVDKRFNAEKLRAEILAAVVGSPE